MGRAFFIIVTKIGLKKINTFADIWIIRKNS